MLFYPQKIEVQPGLYLLSSKLGWILSGRSNEMDDNFSGVSMLIMTHGNTAPERNFCTQVDSVVPTKPDLHDFWNIASIGITDVNTTSDEEKAMKYFKDTLPFKDQRYHVTWLWKEDCPELPVNRQLALGCLKSLVSRLKDKPEFMRKYHSVIEDQLENGIVEKVHRTQNDGLRHYIQHHAVIKADRATTKLRIVYDASAKSRNEDKSLNECLHRGPVLLQDLCGNLLRFRVHEIGLVADIEKAFLQIGLHKDQLDVTRFVWFKDWKNPSMDPENIQEFRFCRVQFGIISSPFLISATVEYHLESYHTGMVELLRNNIYMDNLVTGICKVDEATSLYKNAKQKFSEASMNLREWSSNNDEVMKKIPDSGKAEGNECKILGHRWNRKDDSLSLKPVILFSKRDFDQTDIAKASSIPIRSFGSIYTSLPKREDPSSASFD